MTNSLKYLKQNSRYVLVFILLLIAFFYGKNIDPTQSEAEKDQTIRVLKSQKSLPDNVIKLNSNKNSAVLFSEADFIAGKVYRFTFDSKTKMPEGETIYYKNYDDNKFANKKVEIEFFLSSNQGKKTSIQKINLNFSNSYQTAEFLFQPDDNYDKLEVITENPNEQNDVYLRNPSFTNLSMPSIQSAKSFPAILGQTSLDNLKISCQPSNSHPIASFNSQILAGEIFKANSDNISYVELRPELVGSGGYGYIRAELRTADYKDGQYKVGDVISSQDFDIPGLYQHINKDGTLKVEVSSKVEIGKYYFVGFNSMGASFNKFNFFQLSGSSDKNFFSDGAAVIVDSNNKSKEIGDLYFKIYEAKFTTIQNVKILSGATIQDLGNGTGKYSYQLKKDPSDILDLKSISLADPSKDIVQFNQDLFAIVGPDKNGTSATYQFDTIYPISSWYLDAESIKDDTFGTVLYFSYNGKDWQRIDYSSNKIQQVFQGSGSDVIYLKVEGDGNPAKKFFGLNNLKIEAQLVTKP